MKLYTSNYARNGRNPKAVAISIRPPDWYTGRTYSALAPTWEIVMGVKQGTITNEEYTRRYKLILSKLDPHTIANDLGDSTIMLCYESPDKFCHRHLVADWLKAAGYDVHELLPEDPKQKQVDDLLEF